MIKKRSVPSASPSGIKATRPSDTTLKFSFRFFDGTDVEMCPERFPEGYTRTLMERLRDLSSWTVQQFTTVRHKATRIHPIDWQDTCRPDGFRHLNEQFRAYPAWQFSLSANEGGRVRGLLIDDTFHVIWLDCEHNLYK